jgi:hypothetical protein
MDWLSWDSADEGIFVRIGSGVADYIWRCVRGLGSFHWSA